MQQRFSLALIAGMAWFALILQFPLMINNTEASGLPTSMLAVNYFSYFTILSNILVAICCTACLLAPHSAAGRFFSKATVQTAIAVYIFIVGLVYNLVLRQIWSPRGWQLVIDNILHVTVPLGFVLYWYFFTPRRQLQWKDLLPWLLFPAAYLTYSLLRGAQVDWYPYPFIHAGQLGYGKVALNALGVLAAILITGSLLIAINRRGATAKS